MDIQTEVRVVLKALGFICLVAVGVPANLSILFLFCRLRLSRGRLPPNDFILGNLAIVNLAVLLCRGIPQTLVALGLKRFIDDHGCKVVIFGYRMGRAMSICVTALLGCYQSVSIAPSTPPWNALKRWLPAHLPHAIILLYALNIFDSYGAISYPQAPPSNGSIPEYTLNLEFCIVVYPSPLTYVVNGVILTFRDVFFVAVMVVAAVYMLLVLYRHRQQVKGLQGASQASASASQAVLLLVCTYVVLFGLENALWGYSLTVSRVKPAITDARVFFASCYSALCPVLIIASNRRLAENFQCSACDKTAAEDTSTAGQFNISHATA
ncbi:vomeronasal type-1 receptor 1-like [Scleropages formosus]|uniref:Vomeronasal type-1 receptor n=1 Tax=Scleropages formosus TaxID=113540 RepID=A0A0P7W2U6_SCLFO|nr:olfactory receptor class A-like protein 1 [Scleropages formosus]KPP56839.1 vomeronasal type-1 receptor 1-like [Scleropages formosus]